MNARDMQVEFERILQVTDPEFVVKNKLDSDTIFYYLNAAQNRFININYTSLDSLQETVENLRKNTDTFKALIVSKSLTEGTALEDGMLGTRYKLPNTADDMFYLYLRSFSLVSGTYMDIPDTVELEQDNKVIVPNKLITQNEVEKISTSYYNVPILRQPCATLDADDAGNSYITVYVDKYTKLKGCNITYIRKPKKFNVITDSTRNVIDHCELSENVHQEIVELAIRMFLEDAYKLYDNRNTNSK